MKNNAMKDTLIFVLVGNSVLTLFIILLTQQASATAFLTLPRKNLRRLYFRAYNNPYHPEDDTINEDLSDKDGENLRLFYQRLSMEVLSSEGDEEKVKRQKQRKVNGRYWDTVSVENNDWRKSDWKLYRELPSVVNKE